MYVVAINCTNDLYTRCYWKLRCTLFILRHRYTFSVCFQFSKSRFTIAVTARFIRLTILIPAISTVKSTSILAPKIIDCKFLVCRTFDCKIIYLFEYCAPEVKSFNFYLVLFELLH